MSEYTEEAGKKLDAAMRQLFRDMRRELTPEQREAMGRLLADLRSESKDEDGEECQAAYERGKAEERARVLEELVKCEALAKENIEIAKTEYNPFAEAFFDGQVYAYKKVAIIVNQE